MDQKSTVLHKKIFIIITLITTTLSFSQNENSQGRFIDNVSFGGGFGLNFGNGIFSASVSPSAIYNFNDYVSAGPSLIYSYQSSDFFKTSLYGGSIIGLFNPIPQIQLSTELEQLRVNQTIKSAGGDFDEDFWNTAFFVGAGYRANNITIGLRYNLLFKDNESVYTDAWAPFIRVYF
ncbi:alpha-ketoglutarate decarboxylase [unidentified eubacterium SCB49]|nr:alpha-ketoglutarate decarboxylase [unidentified eubacterium SCB49]